MIVLMDTQSLQLFFLRAVFHPNCCKAIKANGMRLTSSTGTSDRLGRKQRLETEFRIEDYIS